MTFADHVLNFFQDVDISTPLPEGVVVLNPYHDKHVFELCRKFYKQYYSDERERILILGINPGRFGAGLTGIPFTDPMKLEKHCGISNTLLKKPELSADFIYTMIEAFGGPVQFYSKFYFSSVCPLGFIKEGKNLNYYDIRELQESVKGFIVYSLKATINFGINTETCYCLGEGKNFDFLNKLNADHKFFKKIIPLAHPRFIMQYRRKKLNEYLDKYLVKLSP